MVLLDFIVLMLAKLLSAKVAKRETYSGFAYLKSKEGILRFSQKTRFLQVEMIEQKTNVKH